MVKANICDRYVGEWRDDKKDGYCIYKNKTGVTVIEGYWKDDLLYERSKGDQLHERSNEIKSRIIESEISRQINPAGSYCYGFGCCCNPLKGILPSTVFALGPLIVKKLTEIGCIALESGVKVDCTNKRHKRIGISGFGTKVFSDYIDNVFLDPNDIKPEEIVYFLENLFNQIKIKNQYPVIESEQINPAGNYCYGFGCCFNPHQIKIKKNISLEQIEALKGYKITATSASVASLIALKCFLKDSNNREKFRKIALERLQINQEEEQKLLDNLTNLLDKRAMYINPPGILFLKSCCIGALENQSYGVNSSFCSEKYFTNMINEYLSGNFQLYPGIVFKHNIEAHYHKFFCNIVSEDHISMFSSVTDDMVFPFYYVAEFAKELKYRTQLGNETIPELVYQIMQYHNLQTIEKHIDDKFANTHDIKDIAKFYLQLRDNYLASQSMENFEEKLVTIFENHEQRWRPKPPSVRCQSLRLRKLDGDKEEQELFSI